MNVLENHIENHKSNEHTQQQEEPEPMSHKSEEGKQLEEETESIFLSHHVKEFDPCGIELDKNVWNVFLSNDDAKELTMEEKEEVLKLHKYFAHRNA